MAWGWRCLSVALVQTEISQQVFEGLPCILIRHSWFPDDISQLLCWSSDKSSSSTSMLTFLNHVSSILLNINMLALCALSYHECLASGLWTVFGYKPKYCTNLIFDLMLAEVREPLLQFILRGTRMSESHFMLIHSKIVEIFQSESKLRLKISVFCFFFPSTDGFLLQ